MGKSMKKSKAKKAKTTKKASTTKARSSKASPPKKKSAAKKTTKKASKASLARPKLKMEPKKEAAPPKPAKPKRPVNKRRMIAVRTKLLEKKEELTRKLQSELNGLETADKHHLADLEEMASDTQDTDSVCEIMEVGANTLEQVEKAILKVDNGTYGHCEDCDNEIPFERLEVLPFATLCVPCKRKQELTSNF